MADLEKRLVKMESSAAVPSAQPGKRTGERPSYFVRQEVTDEDIAKVVAAWTHIPVSRMLEGERQKLVKMEERLAQRVIGQKAPSRPCPTPCARATGLRRSEPADWLVHFSWPDRRGQDRDGARAGGISLRRRERDGAD